jgi:ribosome-associated translation inhibitor RaiA
MTACVENIPRLHQPPVVRLCGHFFALLPGDHVTRVEVHLSDENTGKSGRRDQRCMLEARIEGRQPVAVTDQAATVEQAVHSAAQKLARLLDSTLERLHDHREKTSGLPLSGTEPASR